MPDVPFIMGFFFIAAIFRSVYSRPIESNHTSALFFGFFCFGGGGVLVLSTTQMNVGEKK